MNELHDFSFEGNTVRTIQSGSLTWFAAIDVVESLGLSNVTTAIKPLDPDERAKFNLGRQGETNFISEPGIYKLIGASRKPAAKRFNRWVTHDVLPSIREQGMYMEPAKVEQLLSNPDTMIEILTRYKESQTEVQHLQEEKRLMQPKVDYFDDLVEQNLLTNFRDTAKELHIGQKAFINWLLEHKYVYRNNGRNKQLKHYAKYDHDLFEYRESVSEWTDKTFIQTLITPKGRATFKLLLEQGA